MSQSNQNYSSFPLEMALPAHKKFANSSRVYVGHSKLKLRTRVAARLCDQLSKLLLSVLTAEIIHSHKN